MAKQAIASPEDLERFATELRRFNQQLTENTRRLKGSFQRVGETWRDQEHQKFAAEFEQTMRTLDRFVQASEKQIPTLKKKAKHLRNYLGQR